MKFKGSRALTLDEVRQGIEDVGYEFRMVTASDESILKLHNYTEDFLRSVLPTSLVYQLTVDREEDTARVRVGFEVPNADVVIDDQVVVSIPFLTMWR